jgi:very-short-patch-repair endonuclease
MNLPYESEIERAFFDAMIPLLRLDAKYEPQKKIVAGPNRYRADMMLAVDGRRVIVECDGAKFHEFWKDQERDLCMIRNNCVDDVYRIRGCDIYFALDQTIDRIQTALPFLFEAGREPHGAEVLSLMGCADIGDTRPILRTIIPADDLKNGIPDKFQLIGHMPGKVIVQVKSAYWNTYFRGGRVWLLKDVLEMGMRNKMAAQEVGVI